MSICHCAFLRSATRKVTAAYDQALVPFGINIAQYSLLRRVERLQPVSLTELGRDTELERSTIGRNVRVLERMGLVETRRSEADLRESVVALTPRGLALLGQAGPAWQQCQQDLEARLGAVRITALREILGAI